MEFQHEKIIYKCFFDLERLVECFSDIFNTSAIARGGGGGAIARGLKMLEKHETNLQSRKSTSEYFFQADILLLHSLPSSRRAICNFPSLLRTMVISTVNPLIPRVEFLKQKK